MRVMPTRGGKQCAPTLANPSLLAPSPSVLRYCKGSGSTWKGDGGRRGSRFNYGGGGCEGERIEGSLLPPVARLSCRRSIIHSLIETTGGKSFRSFWKSTVLFARWPASLSRITGICGAEDAIRRDSPKGGRGSDGNLLSCQTFWEGKA